MSAPENFLERWSRRKLEADEQAATDKAAPEKVPAEKDAPDKEVSDFVNAIADAAKPEFDPASLPPIESIGAVTDIRAFLAPGVPAELTRAALRRAWQADPTIRDFIGIAENQWDFTAPDGVPGFGSLPFGPQVSQMVTSLLEAVPHKPPSKEADEATQQAKPAAELPASAATPAGGTEGEAALLSANEASPGAPDAPESGSLPRADESAALQNNSPDEGTAQPPPRRHGSAVPR